MAFPGRRKKQPQGMRGPNPPRWQNRVSALKWQQKELRRDTGKNFPTWYLGGSDGNSCGSGSSGVGGCPSGRLRANHTHPPPPTPRPGPSSQPGLSPALISLQGQGRGGGGEQGLGPGPILPSVRRPFYRGLARRQQNVWGSCSQGSWGMVQALPSPPNLQAPLSLWTQAQSGTSCLPRVRMKGLCLSALPSPSPSIFRFFHLPLGHSLIFP